MTLQSIYLRIMLLLLGLLCLGCHRGLFEKDFSADETFAENETRYKQLTYEADYSNAHEYDSWGPDNLQAEEPWSLRRDLPAEYLDLTLEQALQIALQNATILSDLGGTILTAPSTLTAIHDPAIVETDPLFGVEAALSQFDARVNSIGTYQKNDQPFNNFFVGGGSQLFQQDLHDYELGITKKTATGTQYSARNTYDYDANNRSQNLFPSAWNTQIEMEIRQPLLQGAGLEFNRIAGPYGRPGVLEGIVIARINSDIAVTDFEMGLRDFISNVENAYWDLFYAYRLLDTSLDARDQSLKTWKSTISRIDQKGITAAKEAQAREQYFRFEEDMYNALAGRIQNATQTGNGSQPGTFAGAGGLYVAERRLRLLLGLPMKEEAVIRPISEPKIQPVDYNWSNLVHEAIGQRPELKKQRQILKSLELQKDASRQFTKPRLDVFGRYRFRGFGDHLVGSSNSTSTDLTQGATENLFGGDFQEWEMGVEMEIPIGFRQGHSAVRNLEIQIARERARLHQQERQIVHDLSNALAELRRVQEMNEFSYNRLVSAQQRLSSLNEDTDSPDEILDAQVRLAEAKSNYYRSLVEHEAALRNVHYEKGTLLPFRNVILADNYSDKNNCYWENSQTAPLEDILSKTSPSLPPEPEANVSEIEPVLSEQRTNELKAGVESAENSQADESRVAHHAPTTRQTPHGELPPVNKTQSVKYLPPPPKPIPVEEAFGESSPQSNHAQQSATRDSSVPTARFSTMNTTGEPRSVVENIGYEVRFVSASHYSPYRDQTLKPEAIETAEWKSLDE